MGCEERTLRSYNLHLINADYCDGNGMPVMLGADAVPKELVPFTEASKASGIGQGVHFFLDDYRFERVWSKAETYANMLARFDCVLAPDFSQFTDMPEPMRLWNEYRKRALSNFWGRCGIEVVPTLCWSDETSFSWCLDGIPEGSVVAVSTVGTSMGGAAKESFQKGLTRALGAVKPSHLLVYGKAMDYDYGNVPVTFYKHNTMGGINGR